LHFPHIRKATVGMAIAAMGWMSPVAGAVLNALRVAFYHRRLADF
jgi:hypothetical protein